MALMARGTNAKKRKSIIEAANDFGHTAGHITGTGRQTPQTDNTTQEDTSALWAAAAAAQRERSDNGVIPHCYHFIAMVKAWVLTAAMRQIPLDVSKVLPHIRLPIGSKDGTRMTLMAAADSCAGINLGELSYHSAMAELYPETVHLFKPLAHFNLEDLIIGGANHNDSLIITHLIVYKTPMQHKGQQCLLSFGLSAEAAATAIVSITFLKKAKALWNFDETSPSIYFQTWNESVAVEYSPPSRRAPPQRRQFQTSGSDDSTVFIVNPTGFEQW